MQEVALDSKIMLLDSPGIVLAAGDASDTTVALRNALRIDSLEDSIAPVEVVLKRTGKEYVSGSSSGNVAYWLWSMWFTFLDQKRS